MSKSKDLTIKDILELTRHYLSRKDQVLIKDAYDFAKIAHLGQKRASGHNWMIHPLKTAYYVAEMELDAPSIAAALLHDVCEDTTYPATKIKNAFGEEINNIVDGLTKISKVTIKRQWYQTLIPFLATEQQQEYERYINNLRKMIVAMSKDIRVILIKLADRTHNMQTLQYLPEDKQQRIARETLELYAPLAYRLGMGKLKGTLEDLAFPYIYPKEYSETKRLAGNKYHQKEKLIEMAKQEITQELTKNNIKAEIHGRKKHHYSLWKKLSRYDNDIEKIYDIFAIRIIVETTEECYKTLGLIHKIWKPLLGRIKDYIAMPKPNGYRSLHTTVFGPGGGIIEFQIRTRYMHQQAEYGIAAHWHYSERKESTKVPKGDIVWLEEMANWQEKLTDKKELVKSLETDFLGSRIFVFTPQGDIHDLPAGSTPIDFAYAIHTDLGNKLKAAKLNGKIVRLNHILDNGDIVEVIKDEKSKGPRRDWLRFAKTHKAISKIKSFTTKNTLPFGR